MKKIKYVLHHFDAIWSVPLAFATFALVGYLLSSMGIAVGTYDLGFVQPMFLAGTVTIGFTNMAIIGIRFTFYTLYKWGYGKKQEDGTILNYSKLDWRALTPFQRYLLFGAVFIFFVSMMGFFYSKFV